MLLFLGISGLFSQEERLIERTVLVLDPVNMSDTAGELEFIGTLVSDTITLALEDLGYNVITGDIWRKYSGDQGITGEAGLGKEQVITFAASLGADVVLNGVFRVEDQEIIIGMKAYDIFTRRIATAVTNVGPAGIGIYDTIDEVSASIAGKIRENLKPLPESVITVEREKVRVETKIIEEVVDVDRSIRVTFYSRDEGAELLLGGIVPIGTITGGSALYMTSPDSVLEIEMREEGYYPRTIRVDVEQDDVDITVKPLYFRSRRDFSIALLFPQVLGAGTQVRYHFFRNRMNVYGTGSLSFIPKTYRLSDNPELSRFIVDLKIGAGIGWYPFIKPESPFRFLIGMGAGADLFYITKSTSPFVFGFAPEARLRFEYNRPRVIFYIEQFNRVPPRYYTTSGWVLDSDDIRWELGVTWKR